tara:strand:+ start:92698 stop:93399 length:702 start_codon:yes stop_codon:yes gene_type:complete
MSSDSIKISIVIPVLNEAEALNRLLPSLQTYRKNGHEIILVDGGSHDRTLAVARPLVDRYIQTVKGRSHQMNEGAEVARHAILLFLHADSVLPETADKFIIEALDSGRHCWGRFNIRLSNTRIAYKVIAWAINLKSTLSGIATGDQAIFVRKKDFEDIGAYDRIPLMEDVALSKKLLKLSRPACIKSKLTTSSRRWEKHGICNTIFLMWRLRIAYFFGVRPDKLVEHYYPDSK